MKKPPLYFKTSVAKCMRDPIQIGHLQTCLLLVDVDVSRDSLVGWTVKQRAIAEDWAIRLHLRASDNIVRVPQKPRFVVRAEKASPGNGRNRSAFTESVLRRKAEGTLAEVL